METIRARISDELKKDVDMLEQKLKNEAMKGAEVTTSSIVRGAIENFIDEHKENTVTIKLDTNCLSKNEIFLLEECLMALESGLKDKIKQQIELESHEEELFFADLSGNIYVDEDDLVKQRAINQNKLSDDEFKNLNNLYLHIAMSRKKLSLSKLKIAGE